MLKVYVKFDESTWKYMYSDSLRKWQTEDINEELLLQEDFSKIHIKNTYEDGALLYNKLLEILYRNPHKGNQDIFILETDSE